MDQVLAEALHPAPAIADLPAVPPVPAVEPAIRPPQQPTQQMLS
jgi:hypothetical protein